MYGRGGGQGGRGRTPSNRGRGSFSGRGAYSDSGSSTSGLSEPFQRLSVHTTSTPGASSSQTLSPPQQQIPVTVTSEAEQEKQLVPVPAKSVKFVARPDYGSVGTKCVIQANHFLVELSDRDLHHYDVSIKPEVTSRKVNRLIMQQLLDENKNELSGRVPAYDGRKGFYTAGPLSFTSKDFIVKLSDRGRAGSARNERVFDVSVKLASRVNLNHLKEFLARTRREAPHETIQALDVVLRESPSNNCIVVGRSFFGAEFGSRNTLGGGVECWTGFYQSLRPTQMGMSLNLDVSFTAFYEGISVIEFMLKFLNLDQARAISRPLQDGDRLKLRKVLRGVRVEVTHGENKRYKITGITQQPLSQLMFTDRDGQQLSVVNYFLEKYNIRLRYTSWPALQSGNDARPTYLPMECCCIIDGQKYPKKLNERQIVKCNDYEHDELAKEFGISIKKEMASVNARVLPPPAKMFNGATINSWMCINFSSLNNVMASGFAQNLMTMCRNKGLNVNPSPVIQTRSSRPEQIDKTLVEVHRKCEADGISLDLLIIILPDYSGTYGNIKKICETELGIISQCCQPRHARKSNPQYLENVALKINVKAGGRNVVLEDAIRRNISLLSDKPTIIFGADVTHPQPGEDSSPSIAAVVASMDWPLMTTYRGLVSAQHHRQEIIEALYKEEELPGSNELKKGGMIRELLISFRRATSRKPERIIFYRDGVSEGQFSQVLLFEVEAIRKACASLEPNYQPPITFVVVQKRHHTRFFATDTRQTDRSGNILPGTVVDRNICHPTEFDFYLCSHAGIQGTSRPVHYHVLYDENNYGSDSLQTMTNNLCYTYARCTRSVSVVPPAYYAHLAAFRARYYLEGGEGIASDSGSGVGGPGAALRRPIVPLPEINAKIAKMPKVKTNRVKYPEGWELIEPTLRELQGKMREAENETHDGKRKCEALWPIFKIAHQKSRYIFDLYYRRKEISKELYEFCLDQGYADRNLIAKWKKPGYERLCCLRCIQPRDHNFATTCVCRVPKNLREEEVIECVHCGCKGCASGD
ncbi:Protein argonaute MEL1 [Linum perenne]